MAASIFGAAFDKLPEETRNAIITQLRTRRLKYMTAMGLNGMQRGYTPTKVVLIGDVPGPGRPSNANYHHTPFYSTKNSSLWLNKQLVEAGIDERDLLWFNSTLADGTKLPQNYVTDLLRLTPGMQPTLPKIIALGGNAETWVRRIAPTPAYVKVFHPQFAKRFRSKEPYSLISEILSAV